MWRSLEPFSLPLHFICHLAMRRQVQELYSFLQDAKKIQMFCARNIGLRIYTSAFVSSGTAATQYSHLTSAKNESPWLDAQQTVSAISPKRSISLPN
ncbi:hypothetical protein AVEN_124133-1 [Araneus ventricosus]|uniref:Uncharacterized protein n=1 Tax=Araneus ventricosus TaxID=182803 RepID=A0A4Y2I5H2_ARAVE|nr:hypothetical protein AVEN_124133-1 [Araneus ventricosus]